MKCVWVEWVDSVHMADWQAGDDIKPARPEVSCGLLVKDEPEYITIALSYAQDTDQFGHLIAIPRVAIRLLQTFNKPSKRKVKAPV